MIGKSLCLLIALVFAEQLFGQVEELRKAQDTRTKYINRETTPSLANASKTTYVNPFI